MNISENEAHSAIYCSENEYFARRCRHYKAKESKAEWLGKPEEFREFYLLPESCPLIVLEKIRRADGSFVFQFYRRFIDMTAEVVIRAGNACCFPVHL